MHKQELKLTKEYTQHSGQIFEATFSMRGPPLTFTNVHAPTDDQNKDNQSKPKENKNQQSKLSPQQIKNLLKAMENAEKKVQAKVNDKKQKGTKVVSEKDW